MSVVQYFIVFFYAAVTGLAIAALLVWAGLVESFLSQYHEPVISYNLKISFGVFELLGLILFLALAGRAQERAESVLRPVVHAAKDTAKGAVLPPRKSRA